MHPIINWFNHLVENKLTRRIIKNTGYLFSATGITAGISMLQGILVARLLGVNNFAILGIITLFTSVINRLVSFRMGELVIKYVGHYTEAEDQKHAAAVFKASAMVEILASIAAYLLLVLLAPLGAKYFAKDAALAPLFIIYGVTILVNLISESSTGLLQIFDRFRNMAGLLIVQSVFTLVIITIIYFRGGGILAILLAYLAGKAIGGIGLSIAAVLEANRQWGRGWWSTPVTLLRDKARELTHFAINTNISSSISLITKDSEILWVSYFRNTFEAGFYKLALNLANMVQMPVSPMPKATYPELSREAARESWGNFRHIMRQGSYIAGGYSTIVTVALILLGRPLIRIVYGEEYLPAYPALVILLVGYLIANTIYWRRPALLALGRPDYPTKLNLILAGLKILAVILLVPKYGYLASASLLAGFYVLNSLFSYLKVHSILKEKEKSA